MWVIQELLVVVGVDVSQEVTSPLLVDDHVGVVLVEAGQEVFAVIVDLDVAVVCLAVQTVECVGPLGE